MIFPQRRRRQTEEATYTRERFGYGTRAFRKLFKTTQIVHLTSDNGVNSQSGYRFNPESFIAWSPAGKGLADRIPTPSSSPGPSWIWLNEPQVARRKTRNLYRNTPHENLDSLDRLR